MKKLTKILAGIAIASTLTIGAAAFAGCNDNKDTTKDLGTAEGAQGFATATAAMVVSGMQSERTDAARPMSAKLTAGQVTDADTIATLNEYMALVEGLLAEGDFSTSVSQNDNAEYAQYAYKMVVTYYDMDGGRQQYVTYYNQTLLGSRTERDFGDDNEVTEAYKTNGVMLINSAVYPVEGLFVNETEGWNETETEQTFKVMLNEAENNYLLVEQSNETDGRENEYEYTYTLFNGGKAMESTSFAYENERNESEIEMEIKDFANRTQRQVKFEREYERGQEIIKIETEENGRECEYIVRLETDENGNAQYVYYSVGGDRLGSGNRYRNGR